jgi:DNA-binding response OmpR family regulator
MPHLRKRVLYVDSDDDTCLMMKVFLEMWNYEAVIARTATAALQQVQAAPCDAYLLDTHLPAISGLELCEQICRVPGHAPVVFISSGAYETDKQRGLKAGAVAYHTKPLNFDALEITLTSIIQGEIANVSRLPGNGSATFPGTGELHPAGIVSARQN